MRIEFLKGGMLTTVQDLGRPDGALMGMPYGGVMDRTSFRLSNHIVGNPENSAVFEITMIGPTIKFIDGGYVAICGADITPNINGFDVKNNLRYKVCSGDVLSFGRLKQGCRAYLAIQGVINVPIYLGSRSTYMYSQKGGYKGRALKKGDIIEVLPLVYQACIEKTILDDVFEIDKLIVTKGPEFQMFSQEDIDVILTNEFQILKDSNRMGCRLSGGEKLDPSKDMISSGTVRGTIQVSNSGELLVLMADSPTTGGYPRIAVLLDKFVDVLAQKQIGDKVTFCLQQR